MQTAELNRILGYIDAHLDAELAPDELANLAGYSPRHFARLFTQVMGETVAHYLVKRRLRRALCEMAAGETAIDAVLRFGFDTYAGFYKAFVRMYGCSPRAYLRIYEAGLPAITEWGKIIMPSKNELKELLRHWPEHANEKIQTIPIVNGAKVSDTAFRVGEDAVLKLYANRRVLERVLKLADALSGQGLNASTPFLTADGEPFIERQNLFVALVRRVPGDPVPNEIWCGAEGVDYARKAGAALSHLHAALRMVEPDMECGEADLFKTCTGWALPQVRKQDVQWGMGLGDAFFENYLTHFGPLSAKLPRQLIHRDPNPSNLMFKDGQFSGFIDFDLFERNARLFDVCYAATGILSEMNASMWETWPAVLHGIVRGYDSVSPLTDAEKQSVYDVVCSIQFIFCAYLEGIDDPIIKQLGATNRRMFSFVVAHRADIESIF